MPNPATRGRTRKAKLDAAYDGSLAYLDDVVGGLLERFAAEPWYDKSLIIITADHGDQLGEKNQLEHANGLDHGVTSIPTMNFFKSGEVVKSVVGARPKPTLTALFDEVLA